MITDKKIEKLKGKDKRYTIGSLVEVILIKTNSTSLNG